MQLPIVESIDPMRVDALLVLGRGIESDGTLSEMSLQRAQVAAQAAHILLPRVVVFSGGRSWRQAATGVYPPSEGGAMLRHAYAVMDGSSPAGVKFCAEEASESTVANMVNSYSQLGISKGESLCLLSDDLHFLYGRPQHIGGKVFKDVRVQTLALPTLYTPEEASEEKLATLATRIVLAGVRRGDLRAIMRRQRGLERVNGMLRRKAASERPGS